MAKKIIDQGERHFNSLHLILPLETIDPEEKAKIERILNSRGKERYLHRIKKQKEKKYDKYWPKYNTGASQLIPSIMMNYSSD